MNKHSMGADGDLAHYGGLVRRRWWILALGVLAGCGLAFALLMVVPKSYTSTSSVIVTDTGVNGPVENGRTSSPINLDTEAQIVTSVVVAEIAGKEIGSGEPARDLIKNVTVTVPPNTSVLDISYVADTPEDAQRGAEAFAAAYLQNRADEASARVSEQGTRLKQTIGELDDELQALDKKIAGLAPGSAERTYQSSQRSQLVDQISALNARHIDLTSRAASGGSVITDAQLPTQPSDPDRKLLVVSGVMTGLLVGVLLAFITDRFDKRIRDRRDLERLGLDALVGRVVVPTNGVIAAPMSSRNTGESLRQLRNALLAQVQSERRSILVTGMSQDTVGSAVALNLAATMARSGLEVVFVVTDSRVTGHFAADVRDGVGLADVLQGRASLHDAIQTVAEEPGLRVVLPGADGSLYSELLQHVQLADILEELAHDADMIVVDVAPVSANADAQTLAALVDGVLLVAAERRTTRPEVIEAIDQLTHVSAHVVGAVIASPSQVHELNKRPTLVRRPSAQVKKMPRRSEGA